MTNAFKLNFRLRIEINSRSVILKEPGPILLWGTWASVFYISSAGDFVTYQILKTATLLSDFNLLFILIDTWSVYMDGWS